MPNVPLCPSSASDLCCDIFLFSPCMSSLDVLVRAVAADGGWWNWSGSTVLNEKAVASSQGTLCSILSEHCSHKPSSIRNDNFYLAFLYFCTKVDDSVLSRNIMQKKATLIVEFIYYVITSFPGHHAGVASSTFSRLWRVILFEIWPFVVFKDKYIPSSKMSQWSKNVSNAQEKGCSILVCGHFPILWLLALLPRPSYIHSKMGFLLTIVLLSPKKSVFVFSLAFFIAVYWGQNRVSESQV